MASKEVNVIGAGLAGCEAAYQLLKAGYSVKLYEQRPKQSTPAHQTADFAELVCSNSLRSNEVVNAVGLLKEEMRHLDSLIIKSADENQVPAGSALAVDRKKFSETIKQRLEAFDNLEIITKEVTKIDSTIPTIIATGPLTSEELSNNLKEILGEEYFYFYDAAAPIIEKETINMDIAYLKSRYDKGEAAYLNCPMNKEQFEKFHDELIKAQVAEIKEFELKVFEGCMPVEVMAKRGKETLLFGPLKPVGLEMPNGEKPYAVVQLRQDDSAKRLYNMVGFQTHLKWPEQKRVFQMIPGLEDANIVRYGVMHRNSYINSPKLLKSTYQLKTNSNIFFAGQITGVEGYVESASSGLVAALNVIASLEKKSAVIFPPTTAIGALANYISTANPVNFQPMNVNFGIIEELPFKTKKKERKEQYAKRALEVIKEF